MQFSGITNIQQFFGLVSLALGILAVLIIAIPIFWGGIRFLKEYKTVSGSYERYKFLAGKALLLGLEFLVASDIIRTVTVQLNLQNIITLIGLVFIRTFISWNLTLDIEGRWPWQRKKE